MKKLLMIPIIGALSLLGATASQAEIRVNYKVTIKTPNIKKAGTDAKISIRLVGTKGSHSFQLRGDKHNVFKRVRTNSGRYLRVKKRVNRFEKGSTDLYEFKCDYLGELTGIYVSHDNKGSNAGWYLGYMRVDMTNAGSRRSTVFPCHRWLASSADDRKVSRYLQPEDKLVRYMVKVHTGSRNKAGTSARVRIDVEGTTNAGIESYQLDTVGDPFEKGSIDTFNIYSKNLGELKSLRVSQDGSGSGSGWYLYKVTIFRINNPRKHWNFVFERWLDPQRGQSATKRL